MVRFTPPVTLKLSQDEVLAWNQAAVRVHVVSGRIWMTQRNDLGDHFLQPGEAIRLGRGARVVISAEQDALLRFESNRLAMGAGLASLCRAAIDFMLPHGLFPNAGRAHPAEPHSGRRLASP